MISFHTWHFMCEGVGQDSGYGHEEFHLMHAHEMKLFMSMVSPSCDPLSSKGRRGSNKAVICEGGRHVALSNIFFKKSVFL